MRGNIGRKSGAGLGLRHIRRCGLRIGSRWLGRLRLSTADRVSRGWCHTFRPFGSFGFGGFGRCICRIATRSGGCGSGRWLCVGVGGGGGFLLPVHLGGGGRSRSRVQGGLRGGTHPGSASDGDHVHHLLINGDDLCFPLADRRCEDTAEGGGNQEESLRLHFRGM